MIDVGTDNSPVDAQNRAGAVIGSNPGVKHWGVWGCNDENETGVVTALANSGVAANNIIGVGLGAYLDCKDWKAGKDTGNKAALYISGAEVGRSAVQALFDKVKNDPIRAQDCAQRLRDSRFAGTRYQALVEKKK